MKSAKNYVIIVCFLISLVVLSGCSKVKNQKLYTIGIVQIVQDVLLDKATQGVIDALKEEGFTDGKNIKIDYRNAQGEISNIDLILHKFAQEKVDMVITNSSPCLVAASSYIKDIPVVFTVAFHPNQLGIKEVPPNITGAYDPLEMDDFVDLIKEILPDVKKIGVPWNPSESNSRFAVENLRKAIKENYIELVEIPVNTSSEVLQVSQVLVSKKVDAIVVSADNTVHSAFESVVKAAEDGKIPIFVTEPSFVERGACAGLGIEAHDWGRASGRMAARIIKGEKAGEIPYQCLTDKRLYINLDEAREQGIKIIDEILKRADKILRTENKSI